MAHAPDLAGPRPEGPTRVTAACRSGWWRALTITPLPVLGAWGLSIASLAAAGLPGAGLAVWAGDPLAALLARGQPAATAALPVLAAGVVLWLALLGGMLDRLARARRGSPPAFAVASSRYWLRFLRVGLMTWPVGALLLLCLGPVRGPAGPGEGPFGWAPAALPLLIGTGLVSVAADLARIRMVVEDRRSAIGALAAAGRFARRRPGRLAGVYALHLVAWVAAAVACSGAPPVIGAGAAATIGLGLGVVVRVGLLGSLVVFFQAELAHPVRSRA